MSSPPSKDDLTVVYSALKNKRALSELAKNFNSNYLDPRLSGFISTIIQTYRNPAIKDVLSLPYYVSEMEKSGVAEEVKGKFVKLWAYFDNEFPKTYGQPNQADLKLCLQNIRNRENNKILQAMANDILHKIENSASVDELNKIQREAGRRIQRIQHINIFDEGSLASDIDNMISEIDAIALNPKDLMGVLSGYKSLDNITTGFHPGELHVICGMEGSGKSTTMMNIAMNGWLGSNTMDSVNFANDGCSIVYFTLEMPRSNMGVYTAGSYLNKRLLGCLTEIDIMKMRNGTLSENEYKRIKKARKFLQEYEMDFGRRFYVVDMPRGASVEAVEQKFLEVQDEIGEIKLIVIDYLGLMCSEGAESDTTEQREIAEGVHEMMRVHRKAGLSAAQMKRPDGKNGTLSNQKFNVTRVARTSEIGRNADGVYMIESGDDPTENEMRLHLVKGRNSKLDILFFRKAFNCMRLYEGSALDPLSQANSVFESFT